MPIPYTPRFRFRLSGPPGIAALRALRFPFPSFETVHIDQGFALCAEHVFRRNPKGIFDLMGNDVSAFEHCPNSICLEVTGHKKRARTLG